jgi:phasin protein
MSTIPQFEIPTDMSKITEQSMEQVQTAINSYIELFQRGPSSLMGGPELTNRVLMHAERNVASAFEFVRKLLQVRGPQDLFMLQTQFIRAQMQAMTEQAKDLSDTATKAVLDSAKAPPTGGLSS